MRIFKQINEPLLIFRVLLLCFLINIPTASADGPCGCYCGKYLPEPCSDEACKQACGWKEPSTNTSSTPSSHDYEAERQRQEEADRQRQKELEEQRKKEEEDTKKKQEEFERNKQEALKNMKGITENKRGLKGVEETGTGDTGLKEVGDSKTLQPILASKANCPPYDPNKPSTVKIDEKNLCPGNLTCMTYFCGGATGCPYVCCPKGAPYLNHCDCKCYSSPDFECKSYSKCEPQ